MIAAEPLKGKPHVGGLEEFEAPSRRCSLPLAAEPQRVVGFDSPDYADVWRVGRFGQTEPLNAIRCAEHYTYAMGNPSLFTDPLGLMSAKGQKWYATWITGAKKAAADSQAAGNAAGGNWYLSVARLWSQLLWLDTGDERAKRYEGRHSGFTEGLSCDIYETKRALIRLGVYVWWKQARIAVWVSHHTTYYREHLLTHFDDYLNPYGIEGSVAGAYHTGQSFDEWDSGTPSDFDQNKRIVEGSGADWNLILVDYVMNSAAGETTYPGGAVGLTYQGYYSIIGVKEATRDVTFAHEFLHEHLGPAHSPDPNNIMFRFDSAGPHLEGSQIEALHKALVEYHSHLSKSPY